jgi:hypothetical protein
MARRQKVEDDHGPLMPHNVYRGTKGVLTPMQAGFQGQVMEGDGRFPHVALLRLARLGGCCGAPDCRTQGCSIEIQWLSQATPPDPAILVVRQPFCPLHEHIARTRFQAFIRFLEARRMPQLSA